MAIPLSYHRITKSYFRTCSTRRCRSQAPFCLCALRMVSNHSEGTFERLRYSFGGDRPSQTPHQTLSPTVIQQCRLEPQYIKSGIPTAAPRQLTSPLQSRRLEFQHSKSGIPRSTPHKLTPVLPSLPPILYVKYRNPILGYSKAPWGLSV